MSISGVQGAPGPRRRLSAEERRESILDAANHVFGEHGYEHVRIDDVAAAAGISKALIYEHFGSKQELYGELMSRAAIDLLGVLVQAASAPGMEGPLRMENAAAAGFLWVQNHPHAFHMFVRDVTDPEISQAQDALRRGAVTAMADVMEMEPPETRAGMARRQTEQIAEMIVGGWYALAEWWLQHPEVPREELMTSMLGFMWLGLGQMQRGARWELKLGGNVRTGAETPSRDGTGTA
ncbi:MAG: TetR/AcrR family transcriptional regulator [Solirubrobacterales bacterium]